MSTDVNALQEELMRLRRFIDVNVGGSPHPVLQWHEIVLVYERRIEEAADKERRRCYRIAKEYAQAHGEQCFDCKKSLDDAGAVIAHEIHGGRAPRRTMEEWDALGAERDQLRQELVECLVVLEVLTGQIKRKFYRELTRDFQEQIVTTTEHARKVFHELEDAKA